MSEKVKIVLLANSIKESLYCVAGINIETKEWIRIVEGLGGEAISWDKYTVNQINKKPPPILSLLELEIQERYPYHHQTENCKIKPSITYFGKLNKGELKNFVQNPPDLWGKSDRISLRDIYTKKVRTSLYLIKVDKINLYLKDRTKYEKQPHFR